jgi:hypothetical protein
MVLLDQDVEPTSDKRVLLPHRMARIPGLCQIQKPTPNNTRAPMSLWCHVTTAGAMTLILIRI